MHVCTRVGPMCVRTYIHVGIYTCMRVCMHACTSICMSVCPFKYTTNNSYIPLQFGTGLGGCVTSSVIELTTLSPHGVCEVNSRSQILKMC